MIQHDNGVTIPTDTPAVRADALRTAREVLLVKSGKFAERDLDPVALIVIADYLITGDVFLSLDHLTPSEVDPVSIVVQGTEVQDIVDRIEDALADVIPFDDGNGGQRNR